MTAGTRRKSRELAMQMLFQADIGKQTPDQVRATFWKAGDEVEPEVKGFEAAAAAIEMVSLSRKLHQGRGCNGQIPAGVVEGGAR